MRKIIEEIKTKVPHQYDMSIRELIDLAGQAKREPCEGVADAFLFGYVMGHRATLNGAYKEKGRGDGTRKNRQGKNFVRC